MSVDPRMADPMRKLAAAFRQRAPQQRIEMTLVHEPAKSASAAGQSVAKGVRAIAWPTWASGL